jgi:arginine/lysine/ornithine decarboxylase
MSDNDNYDRMDLMKKNHDLEQMLKDEREEYKEVYSKMKKQTSSAEFESFYLREENKRLTNENMFLRERLAFYEQ